MSAQVEELRRRAAAAKSLLSRRYNEMEEHRRNSTSTFEDYANAVEIYQQQEAVFQDIVKRWREAHEREVKVVKHREQNSRD